MASVCVIVFAQFILGFVHQSLGLMSEYKKCGDPTCERMISRVQALRDHHGEDCRFLNFKKGDMISVHYKLSGRKSDFWAGSIEKQFGYFPKDAVKIDELFVDETKEIQKPTQKYDFFCIDEFGSVIHTDYDEMDNLEDKSATSQELGNSETDDPVSESTETKYSIQNEEASQSATQDTSRNVPMKSLKSGSGSDRIDSADEWFGNSKQSEPQDRSSDQESFKSRKLSLDTDGNGLKEESQPEIFGWIGDELTNVLGFGQNDLKANDKDIPKDITKTDNSLTTESSSWLNIGIRDVLGFGREDIPTLETKNMEPDTIPKDHHSIAPSEPLDMTEHLQDNRQLPNQAEEQEVSSLRVEDKGLDLPSMGAKNEKSSDKDTGWYGSMYNRITRFYGDTSDKSEISYDVNSLSEADSPRVTATIDDAGIQDVDTSSGSMFSVDHLSAVFDGLKSQLRLDTAEDKEVKDNEEETSEQTDSGKEVFVEQQNDRDEKSTDDNDDLNVSLSPIDVIGEMQTQSDQKPTSEGSSLSGSNLSGNVRQTDNTTKELYIQSDTQERKDPEKVADEGIQTQKNNNPVNRDSSLSHTEQSQADEGKSSTNKQDTDVYDEYTTTDISMDHTPDVYDEYITTDISMDHTPDVHSGRAGTSTQSDGQREKQFPPNDAADGDVVHKMNAEYNTFDSSVDHTSVSHSNLSNKRGNDNTPVRNGDKNQTVIESSLLSNLAQANKMAEVLEKSSQGENKKSINIYKKKGTVMDTNEETFKITQVENAIMNADTVLVTTTTEVLKSHGDDANVNSSNHQKTLANREQHTRSETESHSVLNMTERNNKCLDGSDKRKNEAKQPGVLSKMTGEMPSANIAEGSRTDHMGENEAVDIMAEELKNSDTAHSSEHILRSYSPPEGEVETHECQELKCENDPDDTEQVYTAPGKMANGVLNQIGSQPVEAQEKVLSSDSTAREHSSDSGNADRELVHLSKDSSASHIAFDISHDNTVFEDTESMGNTSEGVDMFDHNYNVELKVKSSRSHTTEEETNYESFIKDEPVAVSGAELDTAEKKISVSQALHLYSHTRTGLMEKEDQTSPDLDVHGAGQEPQMPNNKMYLNLQAHLTEENMKDLLGLFGGHKLSWLDDNLGSSEIDGTVQNNEDFVRLRDFEQTLEYYMKIGTKHQETRSPILENNMHALLQKVDGLLSTLRKKFIPVIADGNVDKISDHHQNECISEGCISLNEDTPVPEQNPANVNQMENSSHTSDFKSLISNSSDNHHVSEVVADGDPVEKDPQTMEKDSTEEWITSTSRKSTSYSDNIIAQVFVEPEESQKGSMLYRYTTFFVDVTSGVLTYVAKESVHLKDVIYEVVSSLPDDIRPGSDLFGLPWEAVLVTALLGLFTVILFSCRFITSIKSRLYASKERRLGQTVAELLDEKCKVLNTLSECKHKFEKLEKALQNRGLSAQASEKEHLEEMSKNLEQSNAQMKSEIERLQEELTSQSKFRKQQEEQLEELEETLKSLEKESKERKSQSEQDKTTLKIHEINTERLQKKLRASKDENTMLLESKAQLVQEAEGWGERLSELEEEVKMCQSSHAGMLEDCSNKDERIKSLTDCLLNMRDWDSDEENTVDASNGSVESQQSHSDFHQKQKVQKLIFAAKMSADLKAIEEDKNRVFAKLADEIKAKDDLQEGIEQLQREKESLESESATYNSEIQKLQQKLQIMTEMYQENELKLHRMLTVEERERSQKEEKLSKAGKKISLAAEELNNYRQRAKDLEEELEKTNQAYKNQITAHEKKAHDNWLAARAADRDLADVKRENALLRQRLTDSLFKMELMEKDPYTRDAPARPPFRGERSPYGPSPLSRPPSETRAFLSPPTLMDGPPRLSPQPPLGPGGRVSRGQLEPPSGGPECERSGPHSDSGSLSPTWERERRGPAPPGAPPPDPAIAYRRPLPGPFPLRPPGPPEAYFADKSDLFLGNSSGISEKDSQDNPYPMPGDMRVPPDAAMRMAPPLDPHGMGLAPPMDPREPRLPRRVPYGPQDFFPRGPVGPPLGMRGMPPPGMFPRAPPMGYPPLRPPPDGFLPGPPPKPPPDNFLPGPPPRPSPPGSEQPSEQPPSPHDVI